ncbi:MAG: chemotaxis protein CheA [Gammaproteobacteria bacterium]
MNEFIEQFLIEARDYVEQAMSALHTLERTPQDAAALDALFRAFHTLKGSAGIVEFGAMERLLHAGEDALSAMRNTGAAVSAELNAACVACLDQTLRWLDAMERTGALPAEAEADAQAARVLQRVQAAFQPGTARSVTPGHAPEIERASGHALQQLSAVAQDLLAAQLAILDDLPKDSFAGRVTSAGSAAANVLTASGLDAAAQRIKQATAQSLAAADPTPLQAQLAAILRGEPEAAAAPAAEQALPETLTRTLRIDAERVEALVRLVGELTIVKNALGHTADLAQRDAARIAGVLKEQHAVLDRITGEMQRAVLGMRVLPLRTVFSRFPPLVREMTAALGKQARLTIHGEATEADKAIVETLFEPLLHVLRNAIGHGIEDAATRARSGKDPVAALTLRAEREGDRVIVEVQDDGAGIDPARVGALAVERGLVTRETLEAMDATAVADLVFAPGFSTAASVTELSGRGVGMDAVRTAIDRIGGAVTLHSEPGRGTRVRFSLPFSVMMTQVMTVEAGGQRFGIPLDAVVETLRVPEASLTRVGMAHAIAHRDRTLPLFELAQLLQVAVPAQQAEEALIVVVTFAGQWGGIRVDKLGERMEVMLKPLEGLLSGLRGITGTTITGDGRVLLVLDMAEVLA